MFTNKLLLPYRAYLILWALLVCLAPFFQLLLLLSEFHRIWFGYPILAVIGVIGHLVIYFRSRKVKLEKQAIPRMLIRFWFFILIVLVVLTVVSYWVGYKSTLPAAMLCFAIFTLFNGEVFKDTYLSKLALFMIPVAILGFFANFSFQLGAFGVLLFLGFLLPALRLADEESVK